ncbi:MAG TPA: type I methionyl aminopeptidase [Dehalococcoidales bacterium]|nr:type I methionyl aminopeptidase [Dehalococcoidales bacterium]
MTIIIKSEEEIAAMRRAGRIVAMILKTMVEKIRPGMETKELDIIAAKELEKCGARSSFKGYHGFPASLCVSVNDEIVHGIPGKRVLREGDIVSLDFGAIFDGFQGDVALTVGVGRISKKAEALIETTGGALKAGISAARAGAKLGDVSHAIQDYAESRGYSVVREYTGHGIGRDMHEEPQIPNFGLPDSGPVLKKGMTLALEPMVNVGDWRTRVGDDRWMVLTADGSLSAHFEHTIAITDGEPEVLTREVYA